MVGGVSRFLKPSFLGIFKGKMSFRAVSLDISADNNKLEEALKYHELKRHVWEVTSF